jgi:hypothetical protein
VLPITDGVRGVHVVFNLRIRGGPAQTFDLTSYLSSDSTRISSLLIRCEANCYRNRTAEFAKITQSFKVKKI